MCKGHAYGFHYNEVYSKNIDGEYDVIKNMYSYGFILKDVKRSFKKDDIVEMKLDMINRKLSIKRRGFTDIDEDMIIIPDIEMRDELKYRMGIYLHGQGNTVKLLEYREFSA